MEVCQQLEVSLKSLHQMIKRVYTMLQKCAFIITEVIRRGLI